MQDDIIEQCMNLLWINVRAISIFVTAQLFNRFSNIEIIHPRRSGLAFIKTLRLSIDSFALNKIVGSCLYKEKSCFFTMSKFVKSLAHQLGVGALLEIHGWLSCYCLIAHRYRYVFQFVPLSHYFLERFVLY